MKNEYTDMAGPWSPHRKSRRFAGHPVGGGPFLRSRPNIIPRMLASFDDAGRGLPRR